MVFLKYRKKLSLMVISFESMAKYVSMPGNFHGIFLKNRKQLLLRFKSKSLEKGITKEYFVYFWNSVYSLLQVKKI